MDKLQHLEETVAHLTRAYEDLSDIVTRQDRDLTALRRRVGMLLEREATREAESGSVALADQRPPHW